MSPQLSCRYRQRRWGLCYRLQVANRSLHSLVLSRVVMEAAVTSRAAGLWMTQGLYLGMSLLLKIYPLLPAQTKHLLSWLLESFVAQELEGQRRVPLTWLPFVGEHAAQTTETRTETFVLRIRFHSRLRPNFVGTTDGWAVDWKLVVLLRDPSQESAQQPPAWLLVSNHWGRIEMFGTGPGPPRFS